MSPLLKEPAGRARRSRRPPKAGGSLPDGKRHGLWPFRAVYSSASAVKGPPWLTHPTSPAPCPGWDSSEPVADQGGDGYLWTRRTLEGGGGRRRKQFLDSPVAPVRAATTTKSLALPWR